MQTSSKPQKSRIPKLHAIRHVVCAVDSQMVYGLSILLSSLRNTSHGDFSLTIGYLGERLSQDDRDFLGEVTKELEIDVEFLPLPDRDIFITQGHISPTTFAKFLLGDHFPTPHVWIDADTVALAGWDQLFDEVAACSSAEGLVVAERGSNSSSQQGKPSDLPFNAGVLGWPAGDRRDWETPLGSLAVVDTQEQFLFNELYASTARRVSEKFNLLTYRVDSLDPNDMPYIIHYAGAHKPWHLRRDLAKACLDHQCPWAAWFEAEQRLHSQHGNTAFGRELLRRQKVALKAGTVRLQRDHSGYNFLRLLTGLAPVAPIVVNVLQLLKQWVPRGTHPIH
jgi:lipopolysaccharide biosynthesis glycosyltransferase